MSAQDLRAAAEAHRELGPEYSDAVVESFLEKIEARLDEHVNARLAELVPSRRRLLARLGADRRHNLLARAGIGVGGIGLWVSLVWWYDATRYVSGGLREFWAAILVASAGSCGAGLARLFRSKRDEPPGSQSRDN
jgi:hypothetical protein